MMENKRAYSVVVLKPDQKTTGDLDIDGRITCKHILKKQVVMSDDGGHSLFDRSYSARLEAVK